MKKIFFTFISILIGVSLAGCGGADIEGIIIKGDEKTVLVAENLSLDRYEEIKDDLSSDAAMFEAMKQEVSNTSGNISLIDFAYDNASEFEVGDKVNVWIEGGVNESFPAQAKAKKISVKK